MTDHSSEAGRPPLRHKTRTAHPCDGCALRRVRCEGGHPCKECQKRLLTCSYLRVPKKRGPKGPRSTTSQRVRSLQRDLELGRDDGYASDGNDRGSSPSLGAGRCSSETKSEKGFGMGKGTNTTRIGGGVGIAHGPYPKHHPQPLGVYCKFLGVFRERLYSVWPVLCCGTLISRLVNDEHDYDAWALAASVCAGVIAQLRLPEHRQPAGSSSISSLSSASETTSHHFAADARHFRSCYDYRERPSVSSLLASFLLHIYCANSDLLSTAGFHLRESLTQAHMLGLHRPDTYVGLTSGERELRLRVYWVLFVSERTYCIQNGLPTILRPISQRPSPDDGPDGCSGSPILAFLYLTKLFTFLEGDLIERPPTMPASVDAASALSSGEGGPLFDDPIYQQLARNKVAIFQSDLKSTSEDVGLDETQRVDIFVTRNWIRILLWEYAVRHFTMSCTADDQAFSILLPALVAHEMLGLMSAVSGKSIRAHGYGMELKVFRIADSLLDILACGQHRGRPNNLLVGSRDALHSLEKVLATVGGAGSLFLGKLRDRMAEVQLPVASTAWLPLPWVDESKQRAEDNDRKREEQGVETGTEGEVEGDATYLDDASLDSGFVLEDLGHVAYEQFMGSIMEEQDAGLSATPMSEYSLFQGSRPWDDMSGPGVGIGSGSAEA